MKAFFTQLKWQFILLQKNNIIGISFGVTLIYGLILYFLKDSEYIDELLVSLVLNDPAVIGYFFIALAVYSEIKTDVLNAIFITPVNIHTFLITKTLALSIIGVLCSVLLALPIKGLDFNLFPYLLGTFGVCLLATLLGIMILTFASEFLNFAMLSIPIFFIFTGISLLHYLNVVDLGKLSYFFPIQGSVDLIDGAVSGKENFSLLTYASLILPIPLFYFGAFKLFTRKFVR
ncbi:MAG: fluoroquinolone transport system permease protein [Arenicella sp.]|jgi:fluoroquinolone transport system permease protein